MRGSIALPSRVRRAARSAAAPGDAWYVLYAVVIVLLVIGFPVVRALAHGLTHPEIIGLLLDPPRGLLSSITAVPIVGAVILGGTIGPAVLQPFLTVHLAGNHLSRSRTLLRPFLLAAAGVMTVCVLLMAIVGWALLLSGGLPPVALLGLLGIAACTGWVVSAAWLFGQVSGAAARLIAVAVAVVIGLVAPHVLPQVLPQVPAPRSWAAPALVLDYCLPAWTAAALLSATAVPWMLSRLRGPELLDHAQRRDHALVAGSVGEVSQALATFRPPPWCGRRIEAIRAGLPFPLTIAHRDLIGGMRNPVRAVTALVGCAVTAILIVTGVVLPPELAWVSATAAGALGFASFGAMSDGFRGAAEGAGRPPLFGVSSDGLLFAHAVVPGVVALLSGLFATVFAAIAGIPLAAGATACTCSFLLVLVRAADSARGPLPVRLLTPIHSPLGDAAGLRVAAWQVEGLLIAVAVVVGSVYAVRLAPGVLAASVAVALVLVVATRRRLHST